MRFPFLVYMEEPTLEAPIELSNVDEDDCGFVIPSDNAELNTDDETMEEVRSKTSETSLHESSLVSPPHSSSSRSHGLDSKRKFRITGLKHPGEWGRHEKLQEMLSRCEHFHVWFDPPVDGVKSGGVSLIFDCPDTARMAFTEAQKFIIDGAPVRMLASKNFYETSRRPVQSFTLSEDPDERERTLYAVYLLESTSDNVLETIIDDIEKVEFLPLPDNRKQAEIVMKTKEAARSAKEDADGFELNDGESTSVMKAFFVPEYVEFITCLSNPPLLSPTHSQSSVVVPSSRSLSNASSSSKSPRKSHHREERKKVVKPTPPPPLPLPLISDIPNDEPSESEVAAAITLIVEEERINWAEINEREELYTLVDKASYKLGGVRDELLRDSLLSVLESSRKKAAEEQSSWMRRHLDELIKLWKKEIASGVPFDRPSRVPFQARIINPIPKEKKRKRGGGGAMARAQFGMGAVLAAARAKFATEEGELDIEETDDGSILIGDVPLSFESWARFNKQPLKRSAPQEEKISEVTKANRRAKRAKMEEEKKKRKEVEKAKKETEKPTKELEEGEMDSDDSDKKDAASSSSSSSSSESDEEGDSRRRRRFRRKNDRSKPPSLPPLFQSIYDNRVAIISQLSVEHRIAFSKVLTQFVNQKGGIDSNQQKTLMTYMANFPR